MTLIQDLIAHLEALDIRVWAEGDRLRCNAPKGVLTQELREELSNRKQELLAYLEQRNNLTRLTPRIQQMKPLPLSFAQERLWFLDQLEEGSNTYNLSTAVELTGKLHKEACQKAFQEIFTRHEILRTAFINQEGTPAQSIFPDIECQIKEVDLQHLDDTSQLHEINQLLYQDAQTPFDLSQIPLLRIQLIQKSTEQHILQVTIHHIITDRWSMQILIREWSSLYTAFAQEKPSPLQMLYIQYADFAIWQRQWLTGEILQKQLSYWQKQLEDAPPLLELPTDYPRPARLTFQGSNVKFQISPHQSEQIKALSQQAGVTPFMTLLAAFTILLNRYSRQEDIVVGTPIANRNRSEIEALMGFFVNTLALRIKIENNPTFEELLTQIKEVTLEAYTHQDLPFEKLIEELKIERSLSHNPLFQVMFVLQNTPSVQIDLPDLKLETLQPENTVAKFDLTLILEEVESGLEGTWEYNTDLFSTNTIHNLSHHFQNLLTDILARTQVRIADLQLLSPQEWQYLVFEKNRAGQDYPQNKCIHKLFEEQVKKEPEAIAVVYEEEYLTYAQLNEKANQLANYLQKLGVEPETLVGICLEKSLTLIIGLLAILKAGGAYVPLDPSYPTERLAYMLKDSQVTVLVTQESLLRKLPELKTELVCLPKDWSKIDQESKHNPPSDVQEINLVYVIYTSGSTGQPKGVMIEHRSLINLVTWHQKAFSVTHLDRTTQLAGIAFDAAGWEIWPYLSVGATLYLVNPDLLQSTSALQNWLQEKSITITFMPTPLAELILELDWSKPSSLRLLLTGGDKLHKYPSESLPFQLINNYGPTENTVVSTFGVVGSSASQVLSPHIGRPIDNTQIYILDKYLHPVPIGVLGELHIGGVGLARGYLNRPELTREKFISNPFSDEPNSRLYKTGDLCRYVSDGNIEYVGRIDYQVKLRGFRIELGEIENILSQIDQVKEVTVILREDNLGDPRIVAYFVGKQDKVDTHEIKRKLRETLPDYMVPSSFVQLQTLPLTPNGKIDRKALPTPDSDQRLRDILRPQTPTQEILTQLWSEILNLKQVSRTDNFFELGGHSLLATQIISRVRTSFRVELPLRSLFEYPILEQLAEQIELVRQGEDREKPVNIKPRENQDIFPLSFAQERLWFLAQLEEEKSSAYNIPTAMKLEGKLYQEALQKSLQALIERHEILHSAIVTQDGQPQLLVQQPLITIREIDLQHSDLLIQEIEVQKLLQAEAHTPFNLKQSPLLRVQLLKLSPEQYLLQLTLHHIVADGWSMEIFFREWSALYEAFAQNKPSPLSPLPVQYVDFASWQREWLQGPVLERQLSYWKKQLGNAPTLLELPTDYPRPPVQSSQGKTLQFSLSQELKEQLKALSQKNGTTLYMSCLAAFAIILARYSCQEDIVIGSPIANRNRIEIESLIGFFVNTLALRIIIDRNSSYEQLLQQVKQLTLEAYNHQDLPFEKLVDELRVERSLSRSPLFQVMFDLETPRLESLDFCGLKTTPLEHVESQTAKFDLSLTLVDLEAGLSSNWEYSTDLFKASTIERMHNHFENLLQVIVTNPLIKISEVSLLNIPERQQLLFDWNDTIRNYPQDQCIQHLFEERVAKKPTTVALVSGLESLTYAQLNAQANQLAHYLQGLGVKPETLVGICVEKSLAMVIAVLGVLKAGAAYVPLDPDYPPERLAYMLEHSQFLLLLATEKSLLSLPSLSINYLLLDKDWEKIATQSTENPHSDVLPENLAYVIYTSGSTGQPKGVMISHGSLVNAYYAWQDAYQLETNTSSHLQMANFSFDVFAGDLVRALGSGNKLVLCPREYLLDTLQLYGLMQREQVDCAEFVPAVMRNLAEYLRESGQNLSFMKILVVGSDSWYMQEYQDLLSLCGPETRLVNSYGVSEATIDSCYFESTGLPLSLNSLVPIGKPFSNTQLYILDDELQPVPIGVIGQLYIGGCGLARGYWRRPDLTEEKFIPHPFSPKSTDRLYKTGDLCRYLSDGNIEYLGRIDNQVKLRGFRIELGEIESVLTKHPQILEAVTVIREDQPREKKLIAYLVGEQLSSLELRRYLKTHLPDYMIPSSFLWLETLPLSPNGKIDRRALPVPTKLEDEKNNIFLAPRDDLERQLSSIWADILERSTVGIQDNFFDLGGHSLLAVKLMAQIQNTFGQSLSIASLFQSPTVESLAALLRNSATVVSWSPLVNIQAQGSKTPFFCVPGAGGNALYLYHLARSLDPERPFYGLQAQGLDGKSAPIMDMETIAQSYVQAIQQIQPQGPYLLGGHSFGGWVAFAMAQQLQRQGHSVGLVAVIDTQAPASVTPTTSINIDQDEAQWLEDLGSLIERAYDVHLGLDHAELVTLDVEQQLDYFNLKLQSIGILPPESDVSLVRGLVNVFQAHHYITYSPQNVHPVPIVLFKAQDHSLEDLSGGEEDILNQPDWGWERLAQNTLEIYSVPGDHMTILSQSHVGILATQLKACLDKAENLGH